LRAFEQGNPRAATIIGSRQRGRFRGTSIRRGYDPQDVDVLLDRIVTTLYPSVPVVPRVATRPEQRQRTRQRPVRRLRPGHPLKGGVAPHAGLRTSTLRSREPRREDPARAARGHRGGTPGRRAPGQVAKRRPLRTSWVPIRSTSEPGDHPAITRLFTSAPARRGWPNRPSATSTAHRPTMRTWRVRRTRRVYASITTTEAEWSVTHPAWSSTGRTRIRDAAGGPDGPARSGPHLLEDDLWLWPAVLDPARERHRPHG
jgi:DivIVA domain-containing protein